MRSELARYYWGPYARQNSNLDDLPVLRCGCRRDGVAYWAHPHFRHHKSIWTFPQYAILGSRLVGFCENYGARQYERRNAETVLEHGRLDISFNASNFFNGPDAPVLYGKISHRDPYFSMGAIFCVEPCSDSFCCLFEDGKYFLCDAETESDVSRVQRGSDYASRLRYLMGVIAKGQKSVA